MISWIFNSILLSLFDTGSFIWGITFHNLKYRHKPIKCLEMRTKIKSVWKIKKIFLCIFSYIWKSGIFSIYLNFDNIVFFVYFKSQISKCSNYIKLLTPVLSHRKGSGQNTKLILYLIHYIIPCRNFYF